MQCAVKQKPKRRPGRKSIGGYLDTSLKVLLQETALEETGGNMSAMLSVFIREALNARSFSSWVSDTAQCD